MISKIYKLPSWLTSPDDKPDYQLWQQLTANPNTAGSYCSTIDANTIEAPDLDTIVVQTGGLGDLETQQLYLSNFINVGTFWYQITNISYAQQTANGVYVVEGKLDIYLSFLVSFFDETTTNSNRIYFHQKHLNRGITSITIDDTTKIQTTQQYLWPEPQQYLLNKHPALKDIGKQQVKTYHILNPDNYSQQQVIPITDQALTSWTTNVQTYDSAGNTGKLPFTVTITTNNEAEGYSYTANNYFGALSYVSSVDVSYAYPVLVVKADVNSNLYTDGDLFPYFLCDWGQNYYSTSDGDTDPYTATITISSSNPNIATYTNSNLTYPAETNSTFQKLFDIASDYYVGLYLFPLPVNKLTPDWMYANGYTPTWTPLSNILNQGVFAYGSAYEPTAPEDDTYGTQAWVNNIGEQIVSQIEIGALCNMMCSGIAGNTFFGVPSFTPINNRYIDNNYSIIEPALMNWMSFNVRLYGQDNLVRPLDFNYQTNTITTDLTNGQMTPTICTCMDALFVYLNYFAITISPPNIMITNIPYYDLLFNLQYNESDPQLSWLPTFWAFNGYNDAIFSAMMKSEVPTPSTAWTNYIANSKNAYDMGLNISNLLAQNAQAEVQVARNNMGIAIANEIGGLGGAIGDIFDGKWGALGGAIGGLTSGAVSIANASIQANTIAPNNADIQQMRYNYMASGKQQDMSRTTSMRVSATATTNTLNDTVYVVIDEVPPLYEQTYIVNYYALNGYIVNKWDMWKYWFNRKLCNFVCCSFFTNAMLPNLNINWKAKIDTLLNQGFRVWCYNNNQQVQINPTTTSPIDWNTVPYNYVLYNSFTNGDYLYNNVEVSETVGTAEIYYLNNGQEGTNEDVQAWVSSFQATKKDKSK